MAESPAGEAWAVSTFNLVALSLVGVIAGHVTGSLTDSLPRFGTLPGIAVFAYLWILTFVATRWAFADGGLDRIRRGEFTALLGRGAIAGAAIGAAFLLGAALVAVVAALVRWALQQGPSVDSSVFLVLLFVGVGAGIAALVGAVVAAVMVLVDAACYWVSTRFVAVDPA